MTLQGVFGLFPCNPVFHTTVLPPKSLTPCNFIISEVKIHNYAKISQNLISPDEFLDIFNAIKLYMHKPISPILHFSGYLSPDLQYGNFVSPHHTVNDAIKIVS